MSGLKSSWELSLKRSDNLVPELKHKKKNDQKIIDTSFYDGLKAAEIVDAAYESFNKSKWIEISHT